MLAGPQEIAIEHGRACARCFANYVHSDDRLFRRFGRNKINTEFFAHAQRKPFPIFRIRAENVNAPDRWPHMEQRAEICCCLPTRAKQSQRGHIRPTEIIDAERRGCCNTHTLQDCRLYDRFELRIVKVIKIN